MDNPATTIKKRSVVLAGHRTSISLEAEFWQALREVAGARLLSVNALVAAIDVARGAARPANLSSALRVFWQKGYEGDPCSECGQLTLVRSGACAKCDTCGATSGCS